MKTPLPIRCILLLTLLTGAQGTKAQFPCEAILKSANYNQIQSLARSEQHSLQKANFCLAEYDTASSEQRAQIEASYKLFSADASGSSIQIKERQRTECDNKYGEYWFSQLGLTTQKIVSDKAMDTVAKCIEANRNGLKIEPTLSESEDSLTVSINWTSPQDLVFKRIILAPSDAIQCKIDGIDTEDPKAFSDRRIKPGEWMTFSCTRIAKKEILSGETVECLPPALVTIDALQRPLTINLFRKCNTDFLLSRASLVDQEISALRNKIIEVDAFQSGLDSRIREITNRTPTRVKMENCQDTGYMQGGVDTFRSCPDNKVIHKFMYGKIPYEVRFICCEPVPRP